MIPRTTKVFGGLTKVFGKESEVSGKESEVSGKQSDNSEILGELNPVLDVAPEDHSRVVVGVPGATEDAAGSLSVDLSGVGSSTIPVLTHKNTQSKFGVL